MLFCQVFSGLFLVSDVSDFFCFVGFKGLNSSPPHLCFLSPGEKKLMGNLEERLLLKGGKGSVYVDFGGKPPIKNSWNIGSGVKFSFVW